MEMELDLIESEMGPDVVTRYAKSMQMAGLDFPFNSLEHFKKLVEINEFYSFHCHNITPGQVQWRPMHIEIRDGEEQSILLVRQTTEPLPGRPTSYGTLVQTNHLFTNPAGCLLLAATQIYSALGESFEVFSGDENCGRIDTTIKWRHVYGWLRGRWEWLEYEATNRRGREIFWTEWHPERMVAGFAHGSGRFIGKMERTSEGRVMIEIPNGITPRIKGLILVGAYILFLRLYIPAMGLPAPQ